MQVTHRKIAARSGVLVALGLILTATLFTAPSAGAGRPAVRLAPSCLGDKARRSACHLIVDYFAALNAGRDRTACALLGERLQSETGGSNCPYELSMSRGTPFRIVGARTTSSGVEVLVNVGLHELDHWRMLTWAASIGQEAGNLRILDTRLV